MLTAMQSLPQLKSGQNMCLVFEFLSNVLYRYPYAGGRISWLSVASMTLGKLCYDQRLSVDADESSASDRLAVSTTFSVLPLPWRRSMLPYSEEPA